MKTPFLVCALIAALATARAAAPAVPPPELPGDRVLADYFRRETGRVHDGTFAGIKTVADWTTHRPKAREQMLEMLGLSPLPEKTDLKPTITGRTDHAEFFVERLHYQSLPGVYVGANLYVPKNLTGKVPAILYVCGHSAGKYDGVAYGAKTSYQHHGAWFARHGYVCLTIDTIQYGELEGLHHGLYWHRMWWWYARGYTPGGVETWNSIRGLDYLQSRPEVDGEKLGMTGRSGGGIYSWYTAAVDERVKAVVPVSGITDMHNQVVDNCVRGHCDCMFYVNTYRWDFAKLAALIAPRPLLISNADKDWIFPLDGVVRLHQDVARIYELHQAADKLGLSIGEGPHKDTQDLQVPAFRWFDRWLKNETRLISVPATKFFQPAELTSFKSLPPDQRTTTIHETFVPMAAPAIPGTPAEWSRQSAGWREVLREKSFRSWPANAPAVRPTRVQQENKGDVSLGTWEFTTHEGVKLPLYVFARGEPAAAKSVRLHVLDEHAWKQFVSALGAQWRLPAVALAKPAPPSKPPTPPPAGSTVSNPKSPVAPTDFAAILQQVEKGGVAVAFLPPWGIGPTAWSGDERAQAHVKRRFMLLGQTLEGMRVWDIQRAIAAMRQPEMFGPKPVQLAGERHQAVNALYASLFADGVGAVEMIEPPASHMSGPDYLNVLRFLDIPQAVAMAAEKRPVTFVRANADEWNWATQTAQRLGWPAGRLQW